MARIDKKNMPCNRPRKSPKPGKKKVVKACSGGKEKIIHYGATGYGHNYSRAARKSFRARHKCSEAKDKLTARYWACKDLWAGPGGSKKSSPKNRKGKYVLGGVLKKQKDKEMKMSPMLSGGAKSIMKKGGTVPKAGIGLIIPQKVIRKKGEKNFEKGKELLGPLLGMMKKGGTIKDACYYKVVSRYGPKTSAYRSGAMAKCRKMGVKNWGNKSKK